MIPPRVVEFCQSGKSVTSELQKNPSEPASEAGTRLFGVDIEEDVIGEREQKHHKYNENEDTAALQQAFECGNFGDTRPSDLFLKVRALDKANNLALLTSCRSTTMSSAHSIETLSWAYALPRSSLVSESARSPSYPQFLTSADICQM